MPLEGDDPAKEARRRHELGERERVAFGHDAVPVTGDHAVQKEPSREHLVTDHVAHSDVVARGGIHHGDVSVENERKHASAAGLDLQATALPQELPGELYAA